MAATASSPSFDAAPGPVVWVAVSADKGAFSRTAVGYPGSAGPNGCTGSDSVVSVPTGGAGSPLALRETAWGCNSEAASGPRGGLLSGCSVAGDTASSVCRCIGVLTSAPGLLWAGAVRVPPLGVAGWCDVGVAFPSGFEAPSCCKGEAEPRCASPSRGFWVAAAAAITGASAGFGVTMGGLRRGREEMGVTLFFTAMISMPSTAFLCIEVPGSTTRGGGAGSEVGGGAGRDGGRGRGTWSAADAAAAGGADRAADNDGGGGSVTGGGSMTGVISGDDAAAAAAAESDAGAGIASAAGSGDAAANAGADPGVCAGIASDAAAAADPVTASAAGSTHFGVNGGCRAAEVAELNGPGNGTGGGSDTADTGAVSKAGLVTASVADAGCVPAGVTAPSDSGRATSGTGCADGGRPCDVAARIAAGAVVSPTGARGREVATGSDKGGDGPIAAGAAGVGC
mmetsp:Transcript_5527/g.15855  ORF Transcript_5527/g.15855 Transcript_5527/m.15855 type:complete len:455 (+) Transcript_5527:1296-2660(+)